MTIPLEQLLAERAELARRVAELDAELEARGVRVTTRELGRPRVATARLLASLASGPRTLKAIAAATGQAPHVASQMLWKLVNAGEVVRVGRATYALPTAREKESAA